MDNDKFIPGLTARAAGTASQIPNSDGKDNGAVLRFLMWVAVILFVAGSEPLKVLLRKNIGKGSLGMKSLLISALAYFAWSYYLFGQLENKNITDLDSSIYLPTIVFYVIFGLAITALGFMEGFKRDYSKYRGDSIFFKSLVKEGILTSIQVQIFVEPFVCIAIGIILTCIHAYLGVPFLITSISFLINELYQFYVVASQREEMEARTQADYAHMRQKEVTKSETYTQVK